MKSFSSKIINPFFHKGPDYLEINSNGLDAKTDVNIFQIPLTFELLASCTIIGFNTIHFSFF